MQNGSLFDIASHSVYSMVLIHRTRTVQATWQTHTQTNEHILVSPVLKSFTLSLTHKPNPSRISRHCAESFVWQMWTCDTCMCVRAHENRYRFECLLCDVALGQRKKNERTPRIGWFISSNCTKAGVCAHISSNTCTKYRMYRIGKIRTSSKLLRRRLHGETVIK